MSDNLTRVGRVTASSVLFGLENCAICVMKQKTGKCVISPLFSLFIVHSKHSSGSVTSSTHSEIYYRVGPYMIPNNLIRDKSTFHRKFGRYT